MPLPNLPWSTQYPGNQDTGVNATDQMPTLQNDSSPGAYDGHRVLVDHVHALRNKLQATALKVGDDVKIPVGSLSEILDITSGHAAQLRLGERASAPTHQANTGHVYTREVSGITELFYKDSNGNEVQVTDAGSPKTPLIAQGDILTRTSTDLVRLGLGSNGQVLTVDQTVPRGVKWAAAGGTDADAIHKSVAAEISTITESTIPGGNDVLVLESYGETGDYFKRRVTVTNLRKDADAGFLQSVLIDSTTPTLNDTLVYDGFKWVPQAGGSGTLDRLLVLSDDTDFAEAGTSFVTKKSFRIVHDSAKPPSAWRLLFEIWIDGGNGTTDFAECYFEAGIESYDSVTLSSNNTAEGDGITKADLTITGDEPSDDFVNVNIRLRVQPGSTGTAHVKYTDCYLIF
ncbi:MAG: hypothetical protein GWN58_23555 [Anaerolineae bacterium]|nr:hypothetical protein [Thermoplasmata archaeon]NIV32308.1 hypothetical protein [Anaerolineae bacterium]NIY03762.1 hypothetical protein [Thermoplasmata archaeon]